MKSLNQINYENGIHAGIAFGIIIGVSLSAVFYAVMCFISSLS